MIVRVWSTGFTLARLDDLVAFARSRLEPFFHNQDGCLGCFFTYDSDEWRTISLWRDQVAVDAVKDSADYRAMLADLVGSGILQGSQNTRVFKAAGGGVFGPLAF
ncbi:MAG: antibiotic biosynthesis monooxygenase [Ferrovibrio sp.]|uniref:antibiotic biosynthesis monooxygenase n=1 Tax=Ferrovibrio sp. TaxID=1917215 RepID=UPI00391AE4AA